MHHTARNQKKRTVKTCAWTWTCSRAVAASAAAAAHAPLGRQGSCQRRQCRDGHAHRTRPEPRAATFERAHHCRRARPETLAASVKDNQRSNGGRDMKICTICEGGIWKTKTSVQLTTKNYTKEAYQLRFIGTASFPHSPRRALDRALILHWLFLVLRLILRVKVRLLLLVLRCAQAAVVAEARTTTLVRRILIPVGAAAVAVGGGGRSSTVRCGISRAQQRRDGRITCSRSRR